MKAPSKVLNPGILLKFAKAMQENMIRISIIAVKNLAKSVIMAKMIWIKGPNVLVIFP